MKRPMRKWDPAPDTGERKEVQGLTTRLPHRPHGPVPPLLFLLVLFLLLLLGFPLPLPLPVPVPVPESGLWVEGVIVDADTGIPVEADVYLDGRLIYSGVRSFSVEVPHGSELRVEAPGYHPWAIEFRYELTGERKFQGPIRLKPKAEEE